MAEKAKFFLAIIPPDPIRTEIVKLREEVFQLFQSKAALKSPPHITLHMPFEWRADREDQLKAKLKKFDNLKRSSEILLEDFDFFEHSVVFIDVVKNTNLIELQKNLARYARQKLNIYNANYKNKAFHPHITIGYRDIKKRSFNDIKEHFSQCKYSAQFKVSDICLLRYNGRQWQEVFYF